MRHPRLIGLLLLTALMLACNFPLFAPSVSPTAQQDATVPAAATETPSVTPLPEATFTPVPTLPPTLALTSTPSVPMVTPNAVNVNCRFGPDVAYDAVSVLMFGSTAEVAGRNEDSSWWYVHSPSNPSTYCWVFSGVVSISGPTAGIPLVQPPAAIVTKLTVGVDLPSTVHCGQPNSVDFFGTITTNGATKVKFRWEVTGAKENTTPSDTLNFNSAMTKNAPDPGAYPVDCGKYTITLHVLSPNDISVSKDFRIKAP